MRVKEQMLATVLLLLFVCSGRAVAQGSPALGFVRIDRNPRTSAFAGAGAASLGNGAYGAFGNAAALSSLSGLGDVFASVQLWEMSNEVDKTTNISGGTGFRFGNFGAALGATFQAGVPMGDYTPLDYLVSLGLSYNIKGKVGIGLNARYAGQNFSPSARTGAVSVDLSVLGFVGKELTVLGGVACLGPRVQGSADTYPQPGYAHAGMAWNHTLVAKHSLELVLDAEYNFDNSFAAALGAEYAYNEMAFLRVGYRMAGQKAVIPSHLALGVGFRFGGFRTDICYLTASPILGNTLSFGVGYRF